MAAKDTNDEVERHLLTIWRQVLGRPFLGRDDNFFDLGGDSLACTQLMLAVEERFDRPLPLSALTSLGSVADMATHLGTAVAETALPEGDAATAWTETLRQQRGYVAAWTGHRHLRDGFIVTMNERGSRPGLFWCCQGHRELVNLAQALGPEQPLHGMRSGNLVMDYTIDAVTSLATQYAQEMMLIQPEGPFLIGGNCQGGLIARAAAIVLRSLGRSVSVLILMEQYEFPPYDEPVTLLFGSDSDFNPYGRNPDPEANFRQAYAGGFTVGIIQGTHGEFFAPPNLSGLAKAVGDCLAVAAGMVEEGATVAE